MQIALTKEQLQDHQAVIDKFFGKGNYTTIQQWDDGYAAYWVIYNREEIGGGYTNNILYCIRSFEIGDEVQFSVDKRLDDSYQKIN